MLAAARVNKAARLSVHALKMPLYRRSVAAAGVGVMFGALHVGPELHHHQQLSLGAGSRQARRHPDPG